MSVASETVARIYREAAEKAAEKGWPSFRVENICTRHEGDGTTIVSYDVLPHERRTATGVVTAEQAARPAQPTIPEPTDCPSGHYYDEWYACTAHNVLVPKEWAERAAHLFAAMRQEERKP